MAGAGNFRPRFKDFRRPEIIGIEEPRQIFAKRLERLRELRAPYDGNWIAISEVASPMRPRFLNRSSRENRPQAHALNVNNKAMDASRILQAGLHSGVTSPARPWFKLTTPDTELAKFGPVKQYLADCTAILAMVFAQSNMYLALQTSYRDLGDYGNDCMIIDPDFDNVVSGKTLSVGEYFWACDDQDRVNTLYREFDMTVRNMVMRFGYERCSQRVKDAWDNANYDATSTVVFAAEPNVNQVRGMPGVRGAPYIAVMFERDGVEDELLEAKPWAEWRASCGRWDARTGEVYAEGPGRMAVGDALALQVLERRQGQMIDKGLKPPVAMPAGIGNKGLHDPGSVTYMAEGQGSARAMAIYQPEPTWVQAISNEIMRHEARIDTTYYVPLFRAILNDPRSDRTAREVAEIHEEKLISLGPVLERIHTEKLDTLITVTFNECERAGILPPPPEELKNVELRVKFTSLLAQAQEMVGIGAIERTVGFAGQLAGANPEVLDKIDFDATLDEYSDRLGTPSNLIRTNEQVQELRGQRQQAQQAAQMAGMMQQGAEGAKLLSDAKMSEDSALTRIAAGLS